MEVNQPFLRGQKPEIKKRTEGNGLAWLNLFGFLGMVTVNYLANALPINNLDTGQLSDKYPNLFVPAGFTFSIWGVIYLLLAVFIFFSLKQALTGREIFPAFKRLGSLFFLTCLVNAGWIFAWHYEKLILSLLVMLTLLILLILIYQRLDSRPYDEIQRDKFPAKLPFSIYLAWISVATVANVTAVLVGLRWNRFGLSEQFWTVLMLAVVLILTVIFIFKKKDYLYALTIIWALLGILYKRNQDTASADRAVEIAVLFSIAIIFLVLIIRASRLKKANR
ncbi:MAG: tryptophan-rich sensory protein [Candidatus Aminicenantes bacterium]|nr:tryptophan-rich sensory protein [Candidatus Aminicenantes bacterium]